MYTFYGDYSDANEYMLTARLHNKAWVKATADERKRAMVQATLLIDMLNFKDKKHAVWQLCTGNPEATDEEIRAAEAAQELEFPRGADTTIPNAIQKACWEIAYELLDGRSPQLEAENLAVVSQGYSSVRTTYQRDVPIEHLKNFIPSGLAWRWLFPFLLDENQIDLRRG